MGLSTRTILAALVATAAANQRLPPDTTSAPLPAPTPGVFGWPPLADFPIPPQQKRAPETADEIRQKIQDSEIVTNMHKERRGSDGDASAEEDEGTYDIPGLENILPGAEPSADASESAQPAESSEAQDAEGLAVFENGPPQAPGSGGAQVTPHVGPPLQAPGSGGAKVTPQVGTPIQATPTTMVTSTKPKQARDNDSAQVTPQVGPPVQASRSDGAKFTPQVGTPIHAPGRRAPQVTPHVGTPIQAVPTLVTSVKPKQARDITTTIAGIETVIPGN